MGLVHLVIMSCENGHGMGGAVYKLPDQTRQEAIEAIESSIRPISDFMKKEGMKFSCPICKSEKMVYTDLETPHDRRRDATEFIETIKQKQVEAARSNNPSTMLFDVRQLSISVVTIPRDQPLN